MSYMDRDWGAKPGGGGVASDIQSKVDRRERLPSRVAGEQGRVSHMATEDCPMGREC